MQPLPPPNDSRFRIMKQTTFFFCFFLLQCPASTMSALVLNATCLRPSFKIVNSASVGVTDTSRVNRSWSPRRHRSPRGQTWALGAPLLRLQYQCQQLWDCLYTDAGVLDDNCLAAALWGWHRLLFIFPPCSSSSTFSTSSSASSQRFILCARR